MKKLSPHKFELKVGEKKKIVFLSFGLKEEIQKIVLSAFIEIKMSQADSVMDEPTRDKIMALNVKRNGITDEKEKKKITKQIAKIQENMMAEYMKDSAKRQAGVADQITEIVFNSRSEILSSMLSERNEKGKITNEVDKDMLLWGEEYAAVGDDLNELFGIALSSVMDALKKTKLQEIISENMGNLTDLMSSD